MALLAIFLSFDKNASFISSNVSSFLQSRPQYYFLLYVPIHLYLHKIGNIQNILVPCFDDTPKGYVEPFLLLTDQLCFSIDRYSSDHHHEPQPPGKRMKRGCISASICAKSARRPFFLPLNVFCGNREIISKSTSPADCG